MKRQQGFVMLIVLMVVLIVGAMSMIALSQMDNDAKLTQHAKQITRLQHQAKRASDDGVQMILNNPQHIASLPIKQPDGILWSGCGGATWQQHTSQSCQYTKQLGRHFWIDIKPAATTWYAHVADTSDDTYHLTLHSMAWQADDKDKIHLAKTCLSLSMHDNQASRCLIQHGILVSVMTAQLAINMPATQPHTPNQAISIKPLRVYESVVVRD